MWLSSLILEALSLLHTKSVLLICDNKRQIGKIRFLLYERMSAYNKRIFLVFKARIGFSFLLCRHGAGKKHNRTVKSKLTNQLAKRLIMLVCKHLRRSHNSRLIATF